MIFSDRLRSLPAHVFFCLFTLFTLAQVQTAIQLDRATLAMLLILALAFLLTGTIGWNFVQRRRRPPLVYAYFCLQLALLILLMLLETRDAAIVPTTTVLAIPLLIQACVFKTAWRVLILIMLSSGTLLLSLIITRDFAAVTLYIPSFTIGFVIFVLIGSLIVGAEHISEKNRQLTLYAAQAEELATLRERNRLAREIHDTLGHYLTALTMQIEAAAALLEADPVQARTFLDKARTLSRDSLTEIRRSIHALRAGPIENRLLHEAIALLVEEHRAAGQPIDFTVRGTIRPGSAAAEMTLYRVAQEGLTNIRKHAQATQTDLLLDYQSAKTVSLVLHDNGIGSNEENSGFGLIGVRERAELLGGQLTIKTGQQQGFTLQVELPL